MHIFMTGVSGFVGSAAARALLADGHTIVAMSRSAASDEVIRELGYTPRVSFEEGWRHMQIT